MSVALIDSVEEHLFQANSNWPRDSWWDQDKYARILAQRFARVLWADAQVEFALAWVDGEHRDNDKKFRGALFTASAVIYGSIANEDNSSYPPKGDVSIVPRRAIRSLAMNHVESLEDEKALTRTFFTVAYDGLPEPLVVDQKIYGYQQGGRAGQLFDTLRADLLEYVAATA